MILEGKNIQETDSNPLSGPGAEKEAIEGQIDQLIVMLSNTRLDTEALRQLQDKLTAVTELLNEESGNSAYLSNLKLESSTAKKYNFAKRATRVIRLVIALLLILLGFGMIIMPAPPYFEMFTLFYLNPNDGVTIMDVISLIVALTGVSLLISGIIKFNSGIVR